MTVDSKNALKLLNQRYFDDHIDEVIWSGEEKKLTIKMKSKDKFEYHGDTAKDMFKQLSKNHPNE